VALSLVVWVAPASALAPVDSVDEIHYAYGNSSGQVVVSWRGDEATLYYGPDTSYGNTVVASTSAITPKDMVGPFREATISGLTPGATYHYRIGAAGLDHTLKAAPAGDLRWVDVGDTGTTLCQPWMAEIHSLVAGLAPDVVTHGGDISYANECGQPAVHRLFTDIEDWSRTSAFQPSWGNHEYGVATASSPPGTPADSLANYKGRTAMANAQTVPNDTATQTNSPGCPGPLPGNNCRGEDWGWFRAGGVLFISYPEPWYNAISSWQVAAGGLMASAQADPSIDFIVTYGHRAAYTSLSVGGHAGLKSALDALAASYSPTDTNPGGKYVLSVEHHLHVFEVFSPIGGLVHWVNGGGGAGQSSFTTVAPGSIIRRSHPSVLSAAYDANAHSLTVQEICGPLYPPAPKDPCVYGSVIYSQTFTRDAAPPPPPPPPPPTTVEYVTNPSVETDLTGWTGKYGASPYVTVTRTTEDARTGVASIKVAAVLGASKLASGFTDQPYLVTNTAAARVYTGSIWVKPGFVGQAIVLRLREWNGSTLVTDRKYTLTAASTGWQQLTGTIIPVGDGNRLRFAVYGGSMNAGDSFLVDDLSLTTPCC
jgi:hypothetical protein